MLTSYISDTSLLLNDPSNQFYSANTLTTLINRARRWMAIRSLQPRVLVTTLSTVAGQETYPITLATNSVQQVRGVETPYGIIGISTNQGNYMVALGRKDFPSFQADDRILNGTFENWPIRFATYNRGLAQVAYLFPIPPQALPMWWDIACIPVNLESDSDPEALPPPWQDIVPFLAARYAFITQQRWQDAEGMRNEADAMFLEASRAEMPFMRPDWYPQER